MQGMREMPKINPKSAEMVEKRNQMAQLNGEFVPDVHLRLYQQKLIKDELAKKTEQEMIEEATRK